jgi:hypothetical protein
MVEGKQPSLNNLPFEAQNDKEDARNWEQVPDLVGSNALMTGVAHPAARLVTLP